MLDGLIIGLIPSAIAAGYAVHCRRFARHCYRLYETTKSNLKAAQASRDRYAEEWRKSEECEKKLRREICDAHLLAFNYQQWHFSATGARAPGEYWINATRLIRHAPNKDAALTVALKEINLSTDHYKHGWTFIVGSPSPKDF